MIECDCLCHTHKDMVHAVACCSRCYCCGAMIRMSYYESHVEKCSETKKVYEEIKNDN